MPAAGKILAFTVGCCIVYFSSSLSSSNEAVSVATADAKCAGGLVVSEAKGLHASRTQKKEKPAPLRAPVSFAGRSVVLRYDQNVYFAVIMTDQRWLGIGTPGV
jgi:hypothetical protein